MWISFAFWPSFVATVISVLLVYMVLRADIRKPGRTPLIQILRRIER